MPLARPFAFAATLLLVALAAPEIARAQSPVFTVTGVEVDVTADSAAAARTRAIDNGHRKAFQRLLERIVPRNQLDKVPKLSAQELANHVRDFEVFDERTSDVRYLASLTFRFQPQSVRQLLRDNRVPFAETRSKPVVVLAVWGGGEDAELWGDPNPWRQAWAKSDLDTGLVPLMVPLGDLDDIRAVDSAQALQPDKEALQKIAAHYEADDVLVTQVRLAGDLEASNASMQVISSRFGTPELERTLVNNVQQQAGEKLEDMLARAVQGVVRDVEESWKRVNLLRFERRQSIVVRVPIDGLQRWIDVRQRLDSAGRVTAARVDRLSRVRAQLEVDFSGTVEQLRVALLQENLVLEQIAPEGSDDADAIVPRTESAAAGDTGWRLRAAEMPMPDDEGADDGAASDAVGTGGSGQAGGASSQTTPDDVPPGSEVRQLEQPQSDATGGPDAEDGAPAPDG